MSDISPRRRLTGRAAIASAFLAVPLTASICYAEGAPGVLVASAQAAEAEVDEWTEADVRQEQEEMAEVEVEIDREFDEAERELAEAERELAEAEREFAEIERELAEGGEVLRQGRHVRVNGKDWGRLDEAERAELRAEMAELRRQFAEDGELRREIHLAVAEAQAGAMKARASAPRVVEACKDDYAPVTSQTDAKGRTTLFICETAGDRIALRAMRQARTAIASEKSLSASQREEALRELDREIAELEASK